MSATLEAESLCAFLERQCGEKIPLIHAEGRMWPVDIRNLPIPAAEKDGISALERHTARVIRRLLNEEKGSILTFLPGTAEIRRVAEYLGTLPLIRIFTSCTAISPQPNRMRPSAPRLSADAR